MVNTNKIIISVSTCISVLGVNIAHTSELAEKIVEAKQKVADLEVQQTKIALQIAHEEQNLKQIENNAMLDTQNFITSEKDKGLQLKNALEKIDLLSKQQISLASKVDEVQRAIIETRKYQQEHQEKELQNETGIVKKSVSKYEKKAETDKQIKDKTIDKKGKAKDSKAKITDKTKNVKKENESTLQHDNKSRLKSSGHKISELKSSSSKTSKIAEDIDNDDLKNLNKDNKGNKVPDDKMEEDIEITDTSLNENSFPDEDASHEESDGNEAEAKKAIEEAERVTEENDIAESADEEQEIGNTEK